MNVLIVENRVELGTIWQRHLERQGMRVYRAVSQPEAIVVLAEHKIDIIILDLFIAKGAAIAVADYANYRQPKARVVFVTNTSFFSDGSIFSFCANACAFLPSGTPPEDLAVMVEHYATGA